MGNWGLNNRELVQEYLKELSGRLRHMRACLTELHSRPEALELAQQLREAAHRLKGSGGTYGFPEISTASLQIETLLDEHLAARTPLSPASMTHLDRYMSDLEKAFRRADRRQTPSGNKSSTAVSDSLPPIFRVITVDDDPTVTRLIEATLGEAGFLVNSVHQSELALEAIEGFQPDLVLLDIDMPKIDGLELCRSLRRQKRFQTLPIVFVTGRAQSSHKVEGLNAGADDYLTKPIDPEELVARCRTRINRDRIVKELGHRDALTGLYNRQYFDEQFQVRLGEAQRYEGQLAVGMLDMDDFKKINDTYGHPMGDRVLQELAKLLTLALRQSDLIARYGGEEFVVLFPGLEPNRAKAALGRLLKKFLTVHFRRDDKVFMASFSGGVAGYPQDAQTSEALIARADEALYRAKRDGKRRIETFSPKAQNHGKH
ncbi:diguanylate cyclase [Candidatus Acetothermia bacterium]|nr:diguanylate cyclase [Candidatus Acetothermia bacterium]